MSGFELFSGSPHVCMYFPTDWWFHSYSRITCTWGLSRTAKKIRFMYPRKETAQGPNFHIHVSMRDLHIPTIGPPIFLQPNRQTDPGNILSRSQKHERRNWVWGRAVSFLGILVKNFRYTVFAVRVPSSWQQLDAIFYLRTFSTESLFPSN